MIENDIRRQFVLSLFCVNAFIIHLYRFDRIVQIVCAFCGGCLALNFPTGIIPSTNQKLCGWCRPSNQEPESQESTVFVSKSTDSTDAVELCLRTRTSAIRSMSVFYPYLYAAAVLESATSCSPVLGCMKNTKKSGKLEVRARVAFERFAVSTSWISLGAFIEAWKAQMPALLNFCRAAVCSSCSSQQSELCLQNAIQILTSLVDSYTVAHACTL